MTPAQAKARLLDWAQESDDAQEAQRKSPVVSTLIGVASVLVGMALRKKARAGASATPVGFVAGMLPWVAPMLLPVISSMFSKLPSRSK